MFTGIVEEIGEIKSIRRGEKSCTITVQANTVLGDTKIGDSIALNGVCLTVTKMNGNAYDCDVMAETLRRSSLAELGPGSKVNLERALAANGRLGGHIVSGHIDGTGTIRSMKREDNAVWITIDTPAQLMKYIVEKGSITIDGVSLTVAALGTDHFSISMIPHTSEATTLLSKKVGDTVNLENDIIAKYVEKLLFGSKQQENKQETQEDLSLEFLSENGFL